jgi:hypothetical protein
MGFDVMRHCLIPHQKSFNLFFWVFDSNTVDWSKYDLSSPVSTSIKDYVCIEQTFEFEFFLFHFPRQTPNDTWWLFANERCQKETEIA